MMAHLGRGLDVSKLGLSRGPQPVTVVMSRHGGVVVAGGDDSRNRESSSLANRGIDHVNLKAFHGSDAKWERLVQCVSSRYAEYGVNIVQEAPARGDYVLAMVGGPPSQLNLGKRVGGLAPHHGGVISDAVVFVFQTSKTTVSEMCQTTAHEIGHALGLDHSRLCSDVMSYESCGTKSFRDVAEVCGEWEDRVCDNGHTHQNSDEHLAAVVGRRNPGPPERNERTRPHRPIAIARR